MQSRKFIRKKLQPHFLDSTLFFSFLGLAVCEIDLKIYCVYIIYFISHSLWSFDSISLNFKGQYNNIRMCLGNPMVVCDLYGLFLHFGYFQSKRLRSS